MTSAPTSTSRRASRIGGRAQYTIANATTQTPNESVSRTITRKASSHAPPGASTPSTSAPSASESDIKSPAARVTASVLTWTAR